MKKNYNLLLLLSIVCVTVQAQTTGSFFKSLTFNSESRTLSCFVPTNYDANKNYPLVVALHGLGDNSENYRNALINSLKWDVLFKDYIIICPDGGNDANSDFLQPLGDEGFIDASIEYIKANYTINSSKIILQGFSLGGRSALKYGLDNSTKFSALLLTTPAIQGIADLNNRIPQSENFFKYENANKIPIYIAYGADDVTYVGVCEKLIEKLKNLDVVLQSQTVKGLAHSIPGNVYLNEFVNFLNSPTLGDYNIDLYSVNSTNRSCDNGLIPSVVIRNLGKESISSVNLGYTIEGKVGEYIWIGQLASFKHSIVNLPFVSTSDGLIDMKVQVNKINGNKVDINTLDNSIESKIIVNGTAIKKEFSYDFEGDLLELAFDKTGSLFGWESDNNVKRTGNQSLFNFNTPLLFYTQGDVNGFTFPILDLTTFSSPFFSFDLAYNYLKYTPPYFQEDKLFADSLELAISSDCGKTYTSIYKKGGAELATVASPIINPTTIPACFFTPTSSEWRKVHIDLSPFKNISNALLKMNYISAMGGSINVDNLKISNVASVLPNVSYRSCFYPNPARDKVFLSETIQEQANMIFYNLQGKNVLEFNLEKGTSEIIIEQLPAGFYNVQLIEGTKISNSKLLIQK